MSLHDHNHAHDHDHAQQASARWCFVCGVENKHGLQIRFFNDGPLRAVARVTLGEPYQSYPGVAHGGIIATILDETMGRAILSDGAGPKADITDERFMFTAKMEVRYRQPVPLHQEFAVRGWVEKDRGQMVQVAGDVQLADGSVAVEGSATLMQIPSDQVAEMSAADVGWRVYP
ncbi:MAG: PaaI family thioesterase [Chloroflexi bacterium]|nr:PaaI family thioesterase [Chloroflexota bacterium]